MQFNTFIPPAEGDFGGFTTATMIEWAPRSLVVLVVLVIAGILVAVWRRRPGRVK